MFEINDDVQLTQDSCKYYKDADPSIYDLCWAILTITGMAQLPDGEMLYDVEDWLGDSYVLYGFELECA